MKMVLSLAVLMALLMPIYARTTSSALLSVSDTLTVFKNGSSGTVAGQVQLKQFPYLTRVSQPTTANLFSLLKT